MLVTNGDFYGRPLSAMIEEVNLRPQIIGAIRDRGSRHDDALLEKWGELVESARYRRVRVLYFRRFIQDDPDISGFQKQSKSFVFALYDFVMRKNQSRGAVEDVIVADFVLAHNSGSDVAMHS